MPLPSLPSFPTRHAPTAARYTRGVCVLDSSGTATIGRSRSSRLYRRAISVFHASTASSCPASANRRSGFMRGLTGVKIWILSGIVRSGKFTSSSWSRSTNLAIRTEMSSTSGVVWLDGHSDYGNSLEMFWDRYGADLTPRSTVIVTGDARNNYRNARGEVLGRIADEVRAVYWLNPEPRGYWDTGDSVMRAYAAHCQEVQEVRNLRQLESFIESLTVPTVRNAPHRTRVDSVG